MEKNIISNRQAVFTLILFIFASTSIIGGSDIASQDSWICVIVGMIISIPIYLMYCKIIKLFPQKNLYEICYEIFGKIGGTIISILFVFYSLQLGSLVMRNFTEFVNFSALIKTPQCILALFLGITCLWVLKQGLELMGRLSMLFFPIMIIFIVITFLLMIKDMNIKNILPIGNSGFKTLSSGSISAVSFLFGESVLFMTILSSLNKRGNPKKVYFTSLFVAAILIVFAEIRNLLVLDVPTISTLYFPSYSAVSVLNVGGFITRIEVVVAASVVASGIIKICVCLYSSTLGIAKVLKIENYKLILTPVSLFLIVFSQFAFQNTFKIFEFVKAYDFYALIFEVLFPIVILIGAEIRVHKNKRIAKCDISYQPAE